MLKRSSTPISLLALVAAAAAFPACSSADKTATSTPAPTSSFVNAARADGLARPTWATSDRLVGRVDANEPMSMQVHLRMRDEAQAMAELAAVSDPDSARYGQFLSNEEFDAKYAPTAADVAAVVAHLEASGLKVTHVPSNRAYVAVEGTAAQASKAFGAQLATFKVGDATKRAPVSDIALPGHVAARVSAVLGFATPATFAPKRVAIGGLSRAKIAPKSGHAHPQATGGTPACSEWYGQSVDATDPAYPGVAQLAYAPCGYTPAQIRNAYGFNESVRKGNDGSGVSVAIVDAYQSPTLFKDAQTYAAQHDPDYPLTAAQFTAIMAPGTPSDPDTGWYGEQTLDVESVHAMAPGADIMYVGAQSASDVDLIAAINLIVSKKLATIVSNSYGSLEQQGNDFIVWHAAAVQAGLKGIGLYFSSGDNGDESYGGWFPPSADFPASLDVVTAVGGTSMALGRDGSRLWELGWETGATFLADSSSSVDGDAGPPPPPAWDLANLFFVFGAGGGTSFVYDQPKWQKDVVPPAMANVPGVPARVVPDVAMLADPITGFLIGQTDDSGVYSEFPIGGTSLASPLFAGTMALAEQHAGKHFGFANPLLYKPSKRSAFRDIGPAASQEACIVPTSDGNALVTFDYPGLSIRAASGYDNVTGLGAPDGKSFLKAIK